MMACLAGAVDVEERAADPVIGNFGRAVALIGHVAIGTGHAGAGMNPLAPELKLRMLGLENLGAGLSMFVIVEPLTVFELCRVPVLLDVLRPQAFAPRKLERHLARAIVFDMALPADERTHLAARGQL